MNCDRTEKILHCIIPSVFLIVDESDFNFLEFSSVLHIYDFKLFCKKMKKKI